MKKLKLSLLIMIMTGVSIGQQKFYTNPILAGFYPDPSICRVGNDYYIVTSSFAYYPGLPIFHSKDLVSWTQIGYAMNRPEQLNLIGAGVSRGLFAPTIRFYKGLYYIVCTLIDKGGNFVITAKDPKGPWSDPAWLNNVDGIDPSLFFDEETGKACIIYNSIPPDNKSLWSGHRTIRMREFDYKNLKAGSEEKLLINGGTDISKKPVWIEAPHIYKINDWYYLLCAEGGTGYNHSEVVFRSKTVEGPYISYEKNPILTQRHLDAGRKNPITTTGHADLVETVDGKWYAVFLGCRPYEDDYYNTGRETFMAPVEWYDDWPVITKGNEEVRYYYPLPQPDISKNPVNSFTGNFTFRDDFNSSQLNYRWQFLRTAAQNWWSLKEKKGFLSLKLKPETCGGSNNPSFVGYRQQHLKCSATTSLNFEPSAENEKAGLVIFQNEQHFYFICIAFGYVPGGYSNMVQLYRSTGDSDEMELIMSEALPKGVDKNIRLQIKADKDHYSFYYGFANKPFQLLADNADGKFLSTKVAGGFVGSFFALYATSSGQQTNAKAYFDWFEYKQ